MSYFKKQPKKTRAIYLNTNEAYYVNEDRTKFSFKISNGINVEDESLLYVKNTTIDYNTSGLSVKQINTPIWTPSISFPNGSTYNAPPLISFISQDGKGSGATAVSILASSGLSTSATTTTTALTVVNGGSGYYGDAVNYISTFTSTSGGQGASVLPTISTSFSGIASGTSAFTTITPAGSTSGALPSTNERWVQFPYGGTGATRDYTFTTIADLYTDMVVLGGGGAGGHGYGGGGGGGAVIQTQKQFYRAGTFIIRIGRGGVPVASAGTNPANGAGIDSGVNYGGVEIYMAKGGGAGGNATTFYQGVNGGSGGGGSGFITDNTNYNIAIGGSAFTGEGTNIPPLKYGNSGGKGNYNGGITMCGGGGGGAGEVGQDAFYQPTIGLGKGGNGGQGISVNMVGTIQILGSGGGGGAASTGSSTGSGGTNAGNGASNGVGSNASAGYGGGGGGGGRATSSSWFAGGSGGAGVVQMRFYASDTATGSGSFTAGTLTAGSGYTDVPTINIPPPPPTVLATFGATPFTASTGTITACPDVLNPTLNGFYNAGTFTVGFQNNPVIAQGFCNTNSSGGLTNIIITNGADNGYYSSSAPLTITSINGVMLGSGFGVGLTYTPTYTGGRCVSIIITNAGNGYGNNLVEAPITFSFPATPTTATITGRTIVQGQLIALTLGSGGAGYKNPTILIDPVSISPPVQAVYAPVYKISSSLQGIKMINHGGGYTLPPQVIIDKSTRTSTTTGDDIPLYAEMSPTNLLQPNYYYTIKADGFGFNRTLYTNQDNKGMPTIAICSTNEIINNEDYIELVLPAQVINELTLEIKERDGSGLGADQSLTTLIEIAELDDKDVWFNESRRREY